MSRSDANPDADMATLDAHAAGLRARFDTVQIFVTRETSDGCTVAASTGAGNWYARIGQVRSWLVQQSRGSQS